MIAVILAGRQEKYFDIPVSLIELVNGVTLLKRTINLLREVSISRILIVTGYKSELFIKFQMSRLYVTISLQILLLWLL